MELMKPVIWVIIAVLALILALVGIGAFIIRWLEKRGLAYYGQNRKRSNEDQRR